MQYSCSKFLKFSITSLIIFVSIGTSFAATQKYKDFNWVSPNGWEGAVFDVPTWFAKDMLYTGREVIRFHDGFYDEKSNGFWTYAFALLVDQIEQPTTKQLVDETHRYFLGLVRELGDNSQKNYPSDKIVVTSTSEWNISRNGQYRSQTFKLQSYDSFTTASALKLNVKITTWLCSDNHRAIHYSVSPHSFQNPLWNELAQEVDALKCS